MYQQNDELKNASNESLGAIEKFVKQNKSNPMKVVKDETQEKEFDNRMSKFEVEEQTAECVAILEQTKQNLVALKQVAQAMVERLEQLNNVEIVKMTKRQRSKRDVHNQEVKSLKMLKAVMDKKSIKLGNEIK